MECESTDGFLGQLDFEPEDGYDGYHFHGLGILKNYGVKRMHHASVKGRPNPLCILVPRYLLYFLFP